MSFQSFYVDGFFGYCSPACLLAGGLPLTELKTNNLEYCAGFASYLMQKDSGRLAKSNLECPTKKWWTFSAHHLCLLLSVLFLSCFDKAHKQRMRSHRPRQKLGVELTADHKGMVFEFRNLHQLSIG